MVNQLKLEIPPKVPGTCDCGRPGVKKDGSGLYCLECEAAVNRATKLAHAMMIETRAEVFFDLRIEQERAKQHRWNAKKRLSRAA